MNDQLDASQTIAFIARLRRKATAVRSAKLGDGTVAIGEGTSVAPAEAAATSVASLLTRHVLRDGEVILLILKPSRWFILLNCVVFAAAVAVVLGTLQLSHVPPFAMRFYVDGGLFLISCRIMWVVLNWMSRLYVLTDRRILRVSGVFHVEVFDCPLRKVGRVRVSRSFGERMLGLGSIEIFPCDENYAGAAWQTIGRPKEVLKKIESAVRRAKYE